MGVKGVLMSVKAAELRYRGLSLQDTLEPGAPLSDHIAITRTVRVAAGVFAPGHLGELTQLVPFEMVDDVLAATGRTQPRVRLLPSRVVVYLLLAACLFAELGYRQVWHRLTAGLDGRHRSPSDRRALRQARRRLGGSRCGRCSTCCAARPPRRAGQVRWRGLLLRDRRHHSCRSPTAPANLAVTPSSGCNHGGSRLPAAAADRAGGLRHPHRHRRRVRPGHHRRIDQARTPGPQPAAGMLLLADRNFAAADLLDRHRRHRRATC